MAVNLVVLGPPGAGKGTQAERFARERGLPKVSTGDILREAVQAGTEVGRAAKATMDAGRLVGDEVMIKIVRDRLEQPDARRGVVLDGFPRNVAQADALDTLLAGRGPLIVVQIVVPDDVLVRRLDSRLICSRCGVTAGVAEAADACRQCGGRLVQRSDDEESIVRERLKVFVRDTGPLIAHYRTRATFRVIDGNQTPDRVAADLRAAVDSAAAADGVRRPNVVEPNP